MTTPTPPDNATTRRSFIQLASGWSVAAIAAAASSAAAVRFMVPNVLYEPNLRFKAGKPDDFPDGSVTFLEDERVFILRQGNAYRCLSAVCTHLGCTVGKAETGFHCPCHGSTFDEEGKVKGGPAPRGLEWFMVTLSKDRHLLVDKNERVDAEKYLVL